MSIIWALLKLYSLLKWMNYHFHQLNECATTTTIYNNTCAIGLVSEPQLELMAILWVRIENHRWYYVISTIACICVQLKNNCIHNSHYCTRLRLEQFLDCYSYKYSLIACKYMWFTYTNFFNMPLNKRCGFTKILYLFPMKKILFECLYRQLILFSRKKTFLCKFVTVVIWGISRIFL